MPSKEWYKENNYLKVLKDYIIKKDRISYILDKDNLPPKTQGFFAGHFKKIQAHDLMKNKYCKKRNIPLYRIRYDENTISRLEEIFNELRC